VPEDVYQKAPNKVLTVTTYPGVASVPALMELQVGEVAVRTARGSYPARCCATEKRFGVLQRDQNERALSETYSDGANQTIGEAEVYVIEATPLSGTPEKLFFDARSGLLVRRYMESETALGLFRCRPITKTIGMLMESNSLF